MGYDICVVGNDEASFEVLNLAASLHQRAIAMLPKVRHSGWLVSEALQSLITNLLVDCDHKRRGLFRRSASPALLRSLISRAITDELDEHVKILRQLGVDLSFGDATVEAQDSQSRMLMVRNDGEVFETRHLVLCTGIRHRNLQRRIGDFRVHSPESLMQLRSLPVAVGVIGGEDFGAGLAGMLSLLGVDTGLVTRREHVSAMLDLALDTGVKVVEHPSQLISILQQKARRPEIVDCRRTVGYTSHLNLNRLDIEPDENGKLWCASNMETWSPHVFGAGSVVGFAPDTALHPTLQAEKILASIMPQQGSNEAAASYLRVPA